MRLALALVLLVCSACGATTSVPAVVSPLGIYELKFAVMDGVGRPVYCDPDFYPIAREGGEQANAIADYPQIKGDPVLYAAIAAHEHLPPGDLTDDEKLTLYRAWKLLRALNLTQAGTSYSFQYLVQASGASLPYQRVTGTIGADGRIAIASRTPSGPPPCPICLAASTLIATPEGAVRVTSISPGMLVWTVTFAGRRVAEPVIEVGSTEVPPSHLMVHLTLADGRDLLVSPGHPTADGPKAGTLKIGDRLGGSTITRWELVPYAAGRTYDLLPAGPTGDYWANGILLSSTLSQSRATD
jgi:hypothetical protein